MGIKVIVTGSTGMVGEGVLLVCLEHPAVSEVLMVNRRHVALEHPRLKECVVPDFSDLREAASQLTGYDACFYCAGISSAGMSEKAYTQVTYDTAVHFAATVAELNPGMVCCHVSGAMTDSSESGKIMWARVKGRAENAILKLPFRQAYNFRPGFMKAITGQQNIKSYYKFFSWLYPMLRSVAPNQVSTLEDVGRAMINSVLLGYSKNTLEIRDINLLAKEGPQA